MSNFTYTSWGRTRQPKNVAGSHGADIDPLKAAVAGNAAHDVAGSYATENQRFLHLLLDVVDGRNVNVVVYGYSHALGRWAPLRDTSGNPVTTGTINNTSAYKIFEIQGVDRLYFQNTSDGATPADWVVADFFRAAMSTF